MANLPFSIGGLGRRHYPAAHWTSWADAVAMVQEWHRSRSNSGPELTEDTDAPSMTSVPAQSGQNVRIAFVVEGISRSPQTVAERRELSKSGPLSAEPFIKVATGCLTRFEPAAFRALLFWRLHFHFVCQHVRSCAAVSPTFLAQIGPHVPQQEFWDGGSTAVASAAARICWEGGIRVRRRVVSSQWQEARSHSRRIATVSKKFSWPSTQVWCRHCVGPACQEEERIALEELNYRKHAQEKNEPGPDSWCSLAKWEAKWSSEIQDFLCALVKAKSRSTPPPLKDPVRSAWVTQMAPNVGLHRTKSFLFPRCSIWEPHQALMGTRQRRSKCSAAISKTSAGGHQVGALVRNLRSVLSYLRSRKKKLREGADVPQSCQRAPPRFRVEHNSNSQCKPWSNSNGTSSCGVITSPDSGARHWR